MKTNTLILLAVLALVAWVALRPQPGNVGGQTGGSSSSTGGTNKTTGAFDFLTNIINQALSIFGNSQKNQQAAPDQQGNSYTI